MQISAHWYSWQTWLISIHCSQKTFHFLSVSNAPTYILSNIVITLRKSHEITFVGYFRKTRNACERCFGDVSETSQKIHLFWDMLEASSRRHTNDIIFEVFLRRLNDITKKTSFWDVFETSWRCLQKVISFEMFLRSLLGVSLNGDLIEISQTHLMPAGSGSNWSCMYLRDGSGGIEWGGKKMGLSPK